MLHYYDINADKTVMVCDKAECPHEPESELKKATCNAQIDANNFAVYNGSIYYLMASDNYNEMELRCRDMDGNNDKKVALIKGEPTNDSASGWFYQNFLFLKTVVSSDNSFDAETRRLEKSVARINCIDLETGSNEVIDETTGVIDIGYSIYKAEDGKLYYYNVKKEKFYIYDLKTKNVEENQVACTAKIGDGLYGYAYGDYCYAGKYRDTENGKMLYQLLRRNIETDEEKVYCEGINLSDNNFYIDRFFIWDFSENWKREKLYVYDLEDGTTTEIKNSWFNQPGMSGIVAATEEGIVFFWAVDIQEGQSSYDGKFEYRYMAMEDLMAGKDDYSIIYCLE